MVCLPFVILNMVKDIVKSRAYREILRPAQNDSLGKVYLMCKLAGNEISTSSLEKTIFDLL
ncbi:MAG: hypothetical protein A2782_04185 [Candidatus Blackburnbacteria bacterium RIFCSPHIGHO2_01_FULL_43_15b]|uniref:Uncharacterized protein n=1 Tax=Candidatus Blackburnbacteria bacterium RIFCSPHIGHO2_01_FULL_43_15b TaxID=1797513 RepID=A0A1G1UZY9_9BACT|nr:MAG: hypothetical protein A2782_04185 [Candidatus Blackburnbacteria bacterium RIFCSPHIGHO2_01_FULL_43_15b]